MGFVQGLPVLDTLRVSQKCNDGGEVTIFCGNVKGIGLIDIKSELKGAPAQQKGAYFVVIVISGIVERRLALPIKGVDGIFVIIDENLYNVAAGVGVPSAHG